MKINDLKLGLLTLAMIAGTALHAQRTTGDFAHNSANGMTQQLNGTVRVIDNKGTIKYLQSNNGITTLTNTTNDVTTTTWQLGGILTDDTFIDLDGRIFALDQVLEVDPALNTPADIPATATQLDADGTTSGWTVLVRDEATGAIKKLKATNLIQSGQERFTATAAQLTYTLQGGIDLPVCDNVYVYRNGAKLLAYADYTVAGSTITLTPTAAAPNDWAVYDGDMIEVHFVK